MAGHCNISPGALEYTVLGRRLYAVGGDEESARLSGVGDKVKIFAYVLSGCLAALVGIMMAARLDQGEPRQAEGWELDAIAATVIGGTSLSGARDRLQALLWHALFSQ